MSNTNTKKLMVAIILFRFIRSDGKAKMLELLHMSEILRKDFALNQQQLEEVFETANQQLKATKNTKELLDEISLSWNSKDKSKLLKYLWILAFADDNIADKERSMISSIAKQLGLTNLQQAKAQEEAEIHLNL